MQTLHALAELRCRDHGPAHDWSHVERVVALARTIALAEGANVEVATTAALLHELWNLPKDHPDSARSGDIAAEHAAAALREAGAAHLVEAVCACIRDHAWSKGVVPTSLEGRILQDADRLDAIGAVGVARCFATAGELGRPFYDAADPLCRARPPDDRRFTLDHFFRKLLHLESRLHTPAARALAVPRVAAMRAFLDAFAAEVGVSSGDGSTRPVHGV
jgi:uncharacterized protein